MTNDLNEKIIKELEYSKESVILLARTQAMLTRLYDGVLSNPIAANLDELKGEIDTLRTEIFNHAMKSIMNGDK